MTSDSFDYVIVGAGSAGCVLAARLSEDPRTRVLLLEAGGRDNDVRIRTPGLWFSLWRTRYDWALTTEPQQHVDGRRMFWPRGKVIGGSGALNAMLYIRGHRDDYDGWRYAGNPGWGWDDVLPLFRRSEDHERGASEWHGVGGPIRVERPRIVPDFANHLADAFAEHCGVKRVDDFNTGDPEGAGIFEATVKNGQRCNSARAYLTPALPRENLVVVTGALAIGLDVGTSRVTGVRYRVGKTTALARARREVILSGGAVGSPHLLMLSGIGPAAQLREHGVPVLLDLPGVGQNLQDHLMLPMTWDISVKNAVPRFSLSNLMAWSATAILRKRGLFAQSTSTGCAFVRTAPGLPRANLQFHAGAGGFFSPNFDEKRPMPLGSFATACPTLIYPKSRGEIRLRSADPAVPPAIDPRYFSDEADLDVLVAGAKLTREIAARGELRRYLGRECRLGVDGADDDAIRAKVRHHVDTIFHPVGTCAMGTGPEAVVDASLRVRGIDGLRVVDASIMPAIIGGNTNAATVMIAEKAVDLITAS